MLPFRVGNKRKPDGKRKLVVVYGPSVAGMFDKGEHSKLIQTEINIEINRSFIAGYKRALCAHMPPLEGVDQVAELRKMRLLLESLL